MKNLEISKNIVINVIKTMNSILFPLITIPYITRRLGPIAIGKINIGNSIISYFSIIAIFGTYIYGIRECSKYINDKKKLNEISSEIYSISIISTFVSFLFLILFIVFNKKIYDYKLIVLIQSIQIILSVLGTDWINIAENDFTYITIRTAVFQILAIILMFCFVKNETDCILYVLISSIVVNGYYVVNIFYRKKYCDISFVISKKILRHIIPLFNIFILLLSQAIFTNIGITILGFVKGDYDAGVISIALKVYNLVNQVISSIFFVFLPKLSYEFDNNNYDSISTSIRYCLNVVVTVGLPCVAGMFMLSDEIVLLLGGVEYINASIPLKILSISLLFSIFSGLISNTILIPKGKDKINLIGSILCTTINCIINIIFIPKYGMISIAISVLVTQLFGLVYVYYFRDRNITINNIPNLLSAPILEVFIIIMLTILIKSMFNNSAVVLAITIMFSVIIYSVILRLFKNEFYCDLLKILKD